MQEKEIDSKTRLVVIRNETEKAKFMKMEVCLHVRCWSCRQPREAAIAPVQKTA
jgi:hypothetical protein